MAVIVPIVVAVIVGVELHPTHTALNLVKDWWRAPGWWRKRSNSFSTWRGRV